MANSKITELSEELTPIGSNLLPTVGDMGTVPKTKKMTFGTMEAAISHTNIANIGTNTHAEIDTHIADTANPHSVTKAQLGLTNVTDNAQYYAGGTDVPVTDGGTGASTASGARTNLGLVIGTDVVAPNQDTTGKSAKTDALNSATTTVDVASATAPTTGQVLTATSTTAATWQTPAGGGGGSTPEGLITLNFENITPDGNKWNDISATGGTLGNTYGGVISLSTSTNIASIAGYRINYGTTGFALWGADPNFSIILRNNPDFASGSADYFIGLTDHVTGYVPSTHEHIGFWFSYASGTLTLKASNANGTTQTTTTLTTLADDETHTFYAKLTSGTNVKFYIDSVLVATHTTNLPSSSGSPDYSFVAVLKNTSAASHNYKTLEPVVKYKVG